MPSLAGLTREGLGMWESSMPVVEGRVGLLGYASVKDFRIHGNSGFWNRACVSDEAAVGGRNPAD